MDSGKGNTLGKTKDYVSTKIVGCYCLAPAASNQSNTPILTIGPELMCVNGEHKVTLYQEEGPLVWTPFEMLSLGAHQKILSCAAADGIDGSTAFLVVETSCKSSKLWVMGPHSANEGPGGGPYIGTMKRARLK